MSEPARAHTTGTERPAREGEVCECGQPAVVVYVTEKFGDVPYCMVPSTTNGAPAVDAPFREP